MSTAIKSAKAIQPLLNRILIQRSKAESKTASGLFLPSSQADKKLNEGTVLAVGPGGLDDSGKVHKMSVSVGQRVLLPAFGGTPVSVGEEEFTLFKESEILAVINE